MKSQQCEPESGVCAASSGADVTNAPPDKAASMEVVYIGDPMCSWCWGISPVIQKLQTDCTAQGLAFRLVVGGLRPGGGDPWNHQFRRFLKQHWQQISDMTGQPFRFGLLDREKFNYDTEPACRAVVAARCLPKVQELSFFTAVQQRFYVDNEDPAQCGFYSTICQQQGVDFDAFSIRFHSPEARAETLAEFELSRGWGVSGFPTVLLRMNGSHHVLVTGYATYQDIEQRLSVALTKGQ